MGCDQGALITLNGGGSWSSWYNQSTAQMYHVSADNAFPYRLCSGQQESGSACVASRGNYGEITFRDWMPVAAEEYGYVVADPLNPDIVYGGKLTRFDHRTNQAQDISPKPLRGGDFRTIRTEPIAFSPIDNKTLYYAGNTLWKTSDGGQNWTQISSDLTRSTWEIPAGTGKYKTSSAAKPSQRGVIYTIAPSPFDLNKIWIGTDDGLIQKTIDGGKNWTDITPKEITAWQKISILEAGHYDADTAYAAVNTLRLDDNRPHIYRTRDGGKTWKEIVNGIPAGQTVNVVREDPVRRGLLFAGTERAVYVSFDDGENWQPLRLNMPAISIRDLIIKDDDLAVGTHGRGFWILDDVTPLRQLTEKSQTMLFKPQTAVRVRWNLNTDTPLPPDEPAGENPPDGAVIDYYLEKNSTGPVRLDIKDDQGNVIRHYSSTDKIEPVKDTNNVPAYWIRPPQRLSGAAGMHRFTWDLHYQPIPSDESEYPIAAVYRNTAPSPDSPWALPGNYSVVLNVGGKSYTQPLMVKIDPRVKTPMADLQKQFDLSKQIYEMRVKLEPISDKIGLLATQLDKTKPNPSQTALVANIDALKKKLDEVSDSPNRRPGAPLRIGVLARLVTLFGHLQEADMAPTLIIETNTNQAISDAAQAIKLWENIEKQDLPDIKKQFKINGLPEISLVGRIPKHIKADKDEDDEEDEGESNTVNAKP